MITASGDLSSALREGIVRQIPGEVHSSTQDLNLDYLNQENHNGYDLESCNEEVSLCCGLSLVGQFRRLIFNL